jgi:hypothetical protein
MLKEMALTSFNKKDKCTYKNSCPKYWIVKKQLNEQKLHAMMIMNGPIEVRK